MPKKISDEKWEDENGRIYQAVYKHDEMTCIYDPTKSFKDCEDYSASDFTEELIANEPDQSCFEIIEYVSEKLGNEYYIAGPTGGYTPMYMFGPDLENSLIMYGLNEEAVIAANSQATNLQNNLDKFYIKPYYDGLLVDQDMGGTNAPLISPQQFESCCNSFLKQRIPNAKKILSFLKNDKSFEAKVIMHNCGNTIPLINYFIDAGINCYQSLQTTAGMDIEVLMNKFGEKLCYWGGVSLEKLIDGNREDVKAEVISSLNKFNKKGFILGPSQSIAMGTKYDNFMTMVETYQNEINKKEI